jgi:HAD superfamily hydrolase (TIGR01509 family)
MINFSRFKAIIFDFDGVLVDSETLQARAWTRVAQELGRSAVITAGHIAGKIDQDIVHELFPGADMRHCMDRKWCIESKMVEAGELEAIAETITFARRMSETHRLAICSSSRRENIIKRLEPTGITCLFHTIMGRLDGVPHKPAPDHYLLTLEALKLEADEACAVEDSPPGVAAAKAAGLFTIQLQHPYLARAAADIHVGSLNELQPR